ncbi:MAG: DNA primase [Bacteroidales bacterium]|nr:DNA primase [Bacteroidales bacterium]
MIPQETVNLILDTARIEDVVSDFVALKRRGANFVACCPFHNEKTPSFYVSPAKGIFKCFGCGKAGSAVGFVMEHEHCSYVEALRYLAHKYNIEIVEAEESAEEIARRQRSESLLLVSEFAQQFFARQLESGEGRSVGYAYFRSRGLEDETIRRFGLGWAPSGRTTFTDAALAAGYKAEYLLDTGLCIQYEDGRLADRFHERAMFPIRSVSGRVIAFSGRTLRSDGNIAKYVNSPETEIYVKSRALYGIYLAKAEISRQDKCILVEGNVDVVSMHQLGVTNVVASCGTSLTVEQVRLIHKFTENVTIMYDGDSAGIHAALRGIDLVLQEGLNVRIVLLPDGEDPDSYARKHTLDQVRDYIRDHEQDFIEFKTALLLEQAGGDPLRKANLINDIADTIAGIPDAVKRSVYVDACATRFGLESDILFERIRQTRTKQIEDERRQRQHAAARSGVSGPAPEPQPEPSAPWTEENRTLGQAERDLLSFLLRYGRDELDFESDSEYYSGSEEEKPTVTDFIRDALEADGTRMANSVYRAIYDSYIAGYDAGQPQDVIVRALLNSEDRHVADVTAQLSTEKYQLTVRNFEAALTTTSSWLAFFVPKAILFYAERRIQDRIDYLRHSLAGADPAQTESAMRDIVRLQRTQRSIKHKLGREKK